REARPGLIVSLSPAPYPWCWENYLLEWPKWAAWTPGNDDNEWWDEFIPQCYRYDYSAFEATWDQQIGNLEKYGVGDRVKDMLAGVLTTGSRPDPVPWADLEKTIAHVRDTGGGGHVWWFSRGVLDVYPDEIAALYDVKTNGHAPHPDRPADWRMESIKPTIDARTGKFLFRVDLEGEYMVIGLRDGVWEPVIGFSVERHGESVDAGAYSVQTGSPDWDRDQPMATVSVEMVTQSGSAGGGIDVPRYDRYELIPHRVRDMAEYLVNP
ncbi:MAG: hypothetical protein AB8F26_12225, partial [Phycisphaerales bacterium]